MSSNRVEARVQTLTDNLRHVISKAQMQELRATSVKYKGYYRGKWQALDVIQSQLEAILSDSDASDAEKGSESSVGEG